MIEFILKCFESKCVDEVVLNDVLNEIDFESECMDEVMFNFVSLEIKW